MIEKITSMQNPKIKLAMQLANRRTRNQTNLFLIEGYRELSRAVQARVKIVSLFICPTLFLGINEKTLIEQIEQDQAFIYHCSESVFKKISYRDRPDGLVAIAEQMHYPLHSISFSPIAFVVIAEAIEKPGNLGTILRSADAAGVDAVMICDRCTDIYNPNVVRASVGTLFTTSVIEATSQEVLSLMREHKIKVVAATPSASQDFTQLDLTGPVAIAVGTEQLGLSDFWMKQADICVRIPMHGIADSLNVATATTLLLYEVVRQRKGKNADHFLR
ncbi:23S rRNA (uridine(2479)-2'-O)-methyltransferase [Candidatus Rhabdochlamydia oedothoracis]|uniref:23S rRNA (Uridine(2479)-2'-O)-methyltransferase n=1 Tax=Candidatus Rhabdochlamydia oedothoracis TaxID=2720720 RepID=A0ABX8V8M5_9BACT|nr:MULTISPECIES: RNA methyltransferase [Rhabdochlamydia]KAG6558911.1 23S rRNA (uridine(2479)-2'-O)-methyltransferase [Candidatus Rhabdochlamydia sp. W815]MCL6756382.1 RNA methyltransferase [Candidatus Rhabdochlamydia oedothoracis]QYF49388.1 23S rRNA (uridine(2479)-2'-O)-methyltransferase [Candidatus Rhabdochlamydia oedothoracis]